MRKKEGQCPLCESFYGKKNHKTHHHIYPKIWYADGTKVEVCENCHQRGFNYLYPMNYVWSREECLSNWVKFCWSKGKNPYEIYPKLR